MASASGHVDALWEAFGNRRVSLTRTDGRRLEGRLVFVGAQVLVLRNDVGELVNISRALVASLQPPGRSADPETPKGPRLRDACSSLSVRGGLKTITALVVPGLLAGLGGWALTWGKPGPCTTQCVGNLDGLENYAVPILAFGVALPTLIVYAVSAVRDLTNASRCRRIMDRLRHEPEEPVDLPASRTSGAEAGSAEARPIAATPTPTVERAPTAPPEPPAPPEPQEDPRPMSLEPGFDRPSADYRWFVQTSPAPEECQSVCARERRCRAFTHLRPGVRGPSALCFLKEKVAERRANKNCVSGTK